MLLRLLVSIVFVLFCVTATSKVTDDIYVNAYFGVGYAYESDNNFIDSNDVEEIEYYMIQKSACIDCINVLHQAHTEYQEDCNN